MTCSTPLQTFGNPHPHPHTLTPSPLPSHPHPHTLTPSFLPSSSPPPSRSPSPSPLQTFGDVIFADSTTKPAAEGSGCPTQYFWESFPASSSPTERTTYLFTYMDLDLQRPSVMDIMEDYWRLLPSYQGVSLDALELRRVLYGLFVSYKDSPLPCK